MTIEALYHILIFVHQSNEMKDLVYWRLISLKFSIIASCTLCQVLRRLIQFESSLEKHLSTILSRLFAL